MTITSGAIQLLRRRPHYPISPARLTLRGSTILDHHGNPIRLRGHNWGRWGAATEPDAVEALGQQANIIRLPIRWWGLYVGPAGIDSRQDSSPGHINPTNLAILDNMISWVTSRGMWAAPFVDSNCGQGVDGAADTYCQADAPAGTTWPNGRNFWTDLDMREKYFQVLEFLVDRYKNVPYIAWWEILPEPNPLGYPPEDVVAFYVAAARRMLGKDPKTHFLVGPYRGYNIRSAVTALVQTSIPFVYTGNLFQFTGDKQKNNIDGTKQRMQVLADMRDTYNVPVFIQQIGVRTGDDPAYVYTDNLLATANALKIGYTWWEFLDTTATPNEYGLKYSDGAGGYITKTQYMNRVAASFVA